MLSASGEILSRAAMQKFSRETFLQMVTMRDNTFHERGEHMLLSSEANGNKCWRSKIIELCESHESGTTQKELFSGSMFPSSLRNHASCSQPK